MITILTNMLSIFGYWVSTPFGCFLTLAVAISILYVVVAD